MHGKAVEREQRLKEKLQAARAKLKELRQRLRERWARRRGSEKRTRSAGGSEAAAAAPRRRGQQRGAPGHGRRQHGHLPVQVEAHDVEPERRRCPACGDEYGAHGSEDSEQLEIEVRAYRRVIKRRRYRRSCQCAAAPALLTAAAPPRLIPKGILGISVWVTVLIDKYLLYRPTYRLLADLRAHGLDLAQGTVTDGMRRLAPLFAPLREALIARRRTGHLSVLLFDKREFAQMMRIAQPMVAVIAKVALPMIVHRHPSEVGQDADFGHRLPAPLAVRRVAGQQFGARHVQPPQLAFHTHPGLIDPDHRLVPQRAANGVVDCLQLLSTQLVDAYQRPHTDRYREQILEQLRGALIRQQPVVLQIRRYPLQSWSVLHRLRYRFRKLRLPDLSRNRMTRRAANRRSSRRPA